MPSNEVEIAWLPSGKPVARSAHEPRVDVSLTHDGNECVCVAGPGAQGCDLATIEPRSSEDWRALLGNRREALLQRLCTDGGPDTPDRAGARIWSALEALQKATGSAQVDLELSKVDGDTVAFVCASPGLPRYQVMTFPVQLTRGKGRVVAVNLGLEATPTTTVPASLSRESYADLHHADLQQCGPGGRLAMVYRFPVTYQDLKTLGRTVNFASFLTWTGKMRELSSWPIYRELQRFFEPGTHAAVTNYARFRAGAEARLQDAIEVRVWLGGSTGKSFNLFFDWRKQAEGGTERLALTELGVTFVEVLGHGVVRPVRYPEFFRNYVAQLGPQREGQNDPDPLPEPLAALEAGATHWTRKPGPEDGPLVLERTFESTLEDSNIVGNIYFSRFAEWQARLRDLYVHSVMPQAFADRHHEFLCVSSTLDFLRDMMPFDRVTVKMSLEALHECGVTLRYQYVREAEGRPPEKLASGTHRALWVSRADGAVRATPLPHPLRTDLDAKR